MRATGGVSCARARSPAPEIRRRSAAEISISKPKSGEIGLSSRRIWTSRHTGTIQSSSGKIPIGLGRLTGRKEPVKVGFPDFRFPPDDPGIEGGPMSRARGNLAAIRLLRQLAAEGRQAAPARAAGRHR